MKEKWSARSRQAELTEITKQTYDVAIIGGGINGAGIALDAAARGLRVILVEKGDFASGTSSKSSKLLHGGLRYLEKFHFHLVFESLSYRNHLMKTAPHLATELPFLFPVYRDYGDHLSYVHVGLYLYDAFSYMSAPRGSQLHTLLGPTQAKARESGLRTSSLSGALLYYDAQTHDSRLVIETLKAAANQGATILNYVEVTSFTSHEGRIDELTASDALKGQALQIRAACIINASGPWIDQLNRLAKPGFARRLQPTKGVHVIVPALNQAHNAIVIKSVPHEDGKRRWLFIIPYGGRSLVGTTDTAYQGDDLDAPYLDEDIYATPEEIDYLLAAVNATFPEANLTSSDVISNFGGWRPLLAPEETLFESDIPREHLVFEGPGGIVCLAGGKLTTFQVMAEETVDYVLNTLRQRDWITTRLRTRSQRNIALSGNTDHLPKLIQRLISQTPGHSELINLWAPRYGSNTPILLDLIGENGEWRDRISGLDDGPDYRQAEVIYATRHERVLHLSDFIMRRTRIFHTTVDQGLGAARRIAELIAEAAGYSDEWVEQEVATYQQEVALSRRGLNPSSSATHAPMPAVIAQGKEG